MSRATQTVKAAVLAYLQQHPNADVTSAEVRAVLVGYGLLAFNGQTPVRERTGTALSELCRLGVVQRVATGVYRYEPPAEEAPPC